MTKKLSLKFVNDGKPFEVGPWTVQKHEDTMRMIATDMKDASSEEQERSFQFYVLLVGLREIDETVTMTDIKSLHPENVVELFTLVYLSGKVDVFFHQKSKGKE